MKQLFRILWGYKVLILIATLACLAGGAYVLSTSTPVYRATSRVSLDVIKPDPMTGTVVGSKQLDAYITSQIRLITDVQVAARAAEMMGWADNPDLQDAYANRPPTDTRPFSEWVAGTIIPRVTVAPVQGTNILEISFRAGQPQAAAAGAEAIRDAFIDASVTNTREGARVQAEELEARAKRIQALFLETQAERAATERQTGVVLSDAGADLESTGLQTLTGNQALSKLARTTQADTSDEPQLGALDASIAKAAAAFGPNHPEMQELLQRRAALAGQMAAQRSNARGEESRADTVVARALGAQVNKIISQRADVARVRILLDQATQLKAQYNAILEQAAKTRELSRVTRGNATALPDIDIPRKPDFPRPGLVIGGTLVVGFLFGSLIALLCEYLNRRVRSTWDLAQAVPSPVLLSLPRAKRRRRWRLPLRRRTAPAQ